MLVPMQRTNRPQLPPKIRIITAWIIWSAFNITLMLYYYVGWLLPRTAAEPSTTAPVSLVTGLAAATGFICIALSQIRRNQVNDLGRKFTLMIVTAALAETVALYGFALKFVFNVAAERALILLLSCAMLQLFNIPIDFKIPEPPQPGEPVIPPNIG